MDIAKTDAGYVSGTVLGDPDKPIHVFRGIPYAAPPVGDLRWKPPQQVMPWSGIRECTAFSASAPQPLTAPANLIGNMPQSEDCLYLNILTPARSSSDRLPVMVWLHGGGLHAGNGNGNLGLQLPLNGVVLVSINMRLGPFGLLAHPLLSTESSEGVSGNYLFLDLIAALKWVQTNISNFGGDPDNVTIFGESGGSTKVVNLMASPLARGLFHRAIGESECGLGTPLSEIEKRGQGLFARLGVDTQRDPLAAARALPWQRICEADRVLARDLNLPFGPPWSPWDSAVDGWFLPDTPANVFKAGGQNAVPFIVGATLGEVTGHGMVTMPWVIQGYLDLFAGANKVGGKAYAYIFNHVPQKWKQEGAACCHGMEVPYVFGEIDQKEMIWAIVFFVAQSSGAKSQDPGLAGVDKQISEWMVKLWTNFARTGNPSLKGLVDWPAWEPASDQYLYITESLQVKSGFSRVAQKS